MIDLGSETVSFHETVSQPELGQATIVVLTTAELAECTCPDFCERDHDVD